MRTVISYIFSAVMVVMSATMLAPERFGRLKTVIIGVYVFIMAILTIFGGEILGVPMVGGLFLLIIVMSERYRLENGIMAAIGYLLNMLCNSLFCLGAVALFRMPLDEFINLYGELFWSVYTIFLWLLLRTLRSILYEKLNLAGHISSIAPAIRYGMFANGAIYTVIFLITISLGERAGYDAGTLGFNCILFFVCMLASSLLIIISASSIRSAEQKKAEEYQKEITENYVDSMEHMVDELRAFKHDYKNIIAQMAGYIREGQLEQLKGYYQKLTWTEETDYYKDLHIWRSLRNIQPMEIKGVLYEKILWALNKGIEPEIKIEDGLVVVYPKIQVVNRILGIFIDNAIEAAAETEEKKLIIEASGTKDGAAFMVANTCREQPDLSKIFQKGVSTKGDGRGMGLYWVKNALREREELVHEIAVKDGMVIQRLEIPDREGKEA